MKNVEMNGKGEGVIVKQGPEGLKASTVPVEKEPKGPEAPSQTTAKTSLKDNKRLLVLAVGAVVLMLLLALAFNGLINSYSTQKKLMASRDKKGQAKSNTSGGLPNAVSVAPILDAGHAPAQNSDSDRVTAELVGQTAKKQPKAAMPSTLGGVKPFDNPQTWRPPAYQPGTQPLEPANGETVRETAGTKSERDLMDKPSLVFVKSNASPSTRGGSNETVGPIELGIGLPVGSRLRARLESAVNTAVRTPVVAVIEYNYEQNGEIVVPAGAKAFGHLEAADRSGYLGIRFDSLLLPDGSSVGVEAAATDLQLRPLRGKVEGKNAGKNILVRSFAGVGEIAATLVGRGNLNQPLSEGDLLRERVINNIGQASDQAVANLAITQRIVVSVPAGTELYVVLQKAAKERVPTAEDKGHETPGIGSTSLQELRQLLQLQRELNQSVALPGSNQ
jgi:hypothetical protein